MVDGAGQRLQIREVAISGPGGRRSSLAFSSGLNVVSGPSDTGKSFLLQCIDYMLGASSPPKEIPETEGYSDVHLSLTSSDGGVIDFSRRLHQSSSVTMSRDGIVTELGAEHDSRNLDNLSNFVLDLLGLAGSTVRTNGLGATRSLSIRDLSRYMLVNETRIIDERSPIRSGQFIDRTVEMSVFRILLDGEDDSGTVEQPARNEVLAQRRGQRQLLSLLLSELEAEPAGDESSLSLSSLNLEVARVEGLINERLQVAQLLSSDISELESKRLGEVQAARRLEAALASRQQLHARFTLLAEQYQSDIERLQATAEAGTMLMRLTQERCPICGSAAVHHDDAHRLPAASPDAVAEACAAEITNLFMLSADLARVIEAGEAEIAELAGQVEAARRRIQDLDEEIKSSKAPLAEESVAELDRLHNRRLELLQAVAAASRKLELQNLLSRVDARLPTAKSLPAQAPRVGTTDEFSRVVEGILKSWGFPSLDRVTWDPKTADLVLDGKPRASFGKGVRALTHAAFSLAVVAFCQTRRRSHPGFVVLDSPLVVYREPDQDERGGHYNVKESFYRSVAADFAESQVIVLENEVPPADIPNATLYAFTRTHSGRSGFVL